MGTLGNLLPFILMFAVVYFLLMIRPQMKRQKQEKQFNAALKKGDKIVMKSGMHGKILELTDTSCVIETLAGKIKFDRSAISMEMSQKVNAPVVEKK